MQGLWGVPNMNSKITKKTGSTQVLEWYKVVGMVIVSISDLAVVECYGWGGLGWWWWW